MTIRTTLAAALLPLLFGAAPVSAQDRERIWLRCIGEEVQDKGPSIGDCTELIEARALSGDRLAHALRARGSAHVVNGEFDRAIADLDRAIALVPTSPEAFSRRAAAHAGKGAFDRAVQDHDETIRLAPDLVEAVHERGLTYEAMGRYDSAIADYGTVLEHEPRFADVLRDRCRVFVLLGRLDRALIDCNAALEMASFVDAFQLMRAVVHLKAGRLDAARADCEAILSVDPRNAGALHLRGIARQRQGDGAGGAADLAQAESIDRAAVASMARYGLK